MKNYKVQSGCANCKKCFVRDDDTFRYYCNENDDRPLCGSVSMNEVFANSIANLNQTQKDRERWEEWSQERSVHPNGICDGYIEA